MGVFLLSHNTDDLATWHKTMAVQCFNKTWTLIDKENRTLEDTLDMIHTAHASRFHWGEIGTILEFLRGEWQISRVYALAGLGESCLFHAEQCLRMCTENNITDFDLAFAYEAVARAHKVCNNTAESQRYLDLATAAASSIAKNEDREYVLSELQNIR